MSDDWKNEDDIKAELRILTDELRTLRHELRDMVAPPKPSPSRAFLHRQSWPSTPSAATAADAKPPADPEKKLPPPARDPEPRGKKRR